MICRVRLMPLKSNIPYLRYKRTGLEGTFSFLSDTVRSTAVVL